MSEPAVTGLLIAAGLTLLGLALLGYSGWARHGGSAAARAWMGNEFGGRTIDERMTVLGAPVLAVICLCAAAIALPGVGKHLVLVALPAAILAFIPFLWAIMLFIPSPNAIYPRWARELRERNRRAEQAFPSSVRRR